MKLCVRLWRIQWWQKVPLTAAHGITNSTQLTPTNQLLMKHIFLILMVFSNLLISCNKRDFIITIENKSAETINSLILNVQDKTLKVDKLETGKWSTIKIPLNSIKLNTHDFRIDSKVNLNNGKLSSGFYYSDLSGIPNSKYIIEIYDSITIIK